MSTDKDLLEETFQRDAREGKYNWQSVILLHSYDDKFIEMNVHGFPGGAPYSQMCPVDINKAELSEADRTLKFELITGGEDSGHDAQTFTRVQEGTEPQKTKAILKILNRQLENVDVEDRQFVYEQMLQTHRDFILSDFLYMVRKVTKNQYGWDPQIVHGNRIKYEVDVITKGSKDVRVTSPTGSSMRSSIASFTDRRPSVPPTIPPPVITEEVEVEVDTDTGAEGSKDDEDEVYVDLGDYNPTEEDIREEIKNLGEMKDTRSRKLIDLHEKLPKTPEEIPNGHKDPEEFKAFLIELRPAMNAYYAENKMERLKAIYKNHKLSKEKIDEETTRVKNLIAEIRAYKRAKVDETRNMAIDSLLSKEKERRRQQQKAEAEAKLAAERQAQQEARKKEEEAENLAKKKAEEFKNKSLSKKAMEEAKKRKSKTTEEEQFSSQVFRSDSMRTCESQEEEEPTPAPEPSNDSNVVPETQTDNVTQAVGEEEVDDVEEDEEIVAPTRTTKRRSGPAPVTPALTPRKRTTFNELSLEDKLSKLFENSNTIKNSIKEMENKMIHGNQRHASKVQEMNDNLSDINLQLMDMKKTLAAHSMKRKGEIIDAESAITAMFPVNKCGQDVDLLFAHPISQKVLAETIWRAIGLEGFKEATLSQILTQTTYILFTIEQCAHTFVPASSRGRQHGEGWERTEMPKGFFELMEKYVLREWGGLQTATARSPKKAKSWKQQLAGQFSNHRDTHFNYKARKDETWEDFLKTRYQDKTAYAEKYYDPDREGAPLQKMTLKEEEKKYVEDSTNLTSMADLKCRHTRTRTGFGKPISAGIDFNIDDVREAINNLAKVQYGLEKDDLAPDVSNMTTQKEIDNFYQAMVDKHRRDDRFKVNVSEARKRANQGQDEDVSDDESNATPGGKRKRRGNDEDEDETGNTSKVAAKRATRAKKRLNM